MYDYIVVGERLFTISYPVEIVRREFSVRFKHSKLSHLNIYQSKENTFYLV